MTRIVAVCGKCQSGKTTYARDRVLLSKCIAIVGDNEFYAAEWSGAASVVKSLTDDVPPQCDVVWEVNSEIIGVPRASEVLRWCREHFVQNLFVLVQHERCVPRILRENIVNL